jgi:transposase
MTGRYERVEVITGVARRRWSAEEKLRIVGDLSRPGASVLSVARDHDVDASLLFKWRRLAREGALGRCRMAGLRSCRSAVVSRRFSKG